MCIAIMKPEGKVLSKELLATCYKSNPDGAGFAYINTDVMNVKRLIVYKSMDFESFYAQYERAIRTNPESKFLIHFRIGTHGVRNKTNCHPFYINKDMAFIHNGIINSVPKDSLISDTQVFNNLVLKKLPKGWESNEGITRMIADFIGYSKLITLDINNQATIINESLGHWYEGCWMSNRSYEPPKVYNIPYSGKYSGNRSSRSSVMYPIISGNSLDTCSYCNSVKQLRKMDFYKDNSDPEIIIICKECACDLATLGMLVGTTEKSLGDYIIDVNKANKLEAANKANNQAIYDSTDYDERSFMM